MSFGFFYGLGHPSKHYSASQSPSRSSSLAVPGNGETDQRSLRQGRFLSALSRGIGGNGLAQSPDALTHTGGPMLATVADSVVAHQRRPPSIREVRVRQ